MVKKFTIPFASQGDANDIPDALQVDGKVSFTQGFGYDYERPYDDPQSKDIAREDMNGIFKAITSAVGELQTLGASEWSSAISYPKGAIVYYEKDLYISQVDDNQNEPPQNWVSITSIANDSLKKAANLSDLTNKTTARNNLGLGSSATLNKTDVLGASTSLVATQKLVNDTKINLENSKQDKLTFTGTGNVARMSEVNKKMDDGAYGLGKNLSWRSGETFDSFGKKYSGLVSAYNGASVPSDSPLYGAKKLLQFGQGGVWETQILSDAYANNLWVRTRKSSEGVYGDWDRIALIKDIPAVSQSTGSSTTNVMSQKAVTDRLNAIESEHGLGYGQSWVDVTSQRAADTTYTNNTGKPIFLSITLSKVDGMSVFSRLYVDSVVVAGAVESLREGFQETLTAIVPIGSKYRALPGSSSSITNWAELR